MKRSPALLPMLAGFFVMGFSDIIGTVMNQVKAECALSDVTAGFLPSMIFIWFFLISIPPAVGMLLAALPTLKYAMSDKEHTRMLDELNAKRNAE